MGHGWFTTAMMANQDFYNGLSDADKKLVQDAADFAFEEIIVHIDGLADEALAKIQKASDEVCHPSERRTDRSLQGPCAPGGREVHRNDWRQWQRTAEPVQSRPGSSSEQLRLGEPLPPAPAGGQLC